MALSLQAKHGLAHDDPQDDDKYDHDKNCSGNKAQHKAAAQHVKYRLLDTSGGTRRNNQGKRPIDRSHGNRRDKGIQLHTRDKQAIDCPAYKT